MRIGILSDTHNELDRTRRAVDRLAEEGAEALFHCGDLAIPEIVQACAGLPFHFVFGNHDADMVRHLEMAAEDCGATCLGWGGMVELAGKEIAMAHGHLASDLRPLEEPDYLLFGHFHVPLDLRDGGTRRINPGALYRVDEYTVAMLDLENDDLRMIEL